VQLSLFHDVPSSRPCAERFDKENVLERLKALDCEARQNGLESLDPTKNPLIGLGMEVDRSGRVTKNSYGVFNLSWQAEAHPEWPAMIREELEEIKASIRDTHKTPLRFLIWAGMGGSAEDKAMYNAVGLLDRGPRVYVLDSTDPAKLKAILDDMMNRAKAPLPAVLRSTLVVGMAMGMTSYEPVVNLEKLYALYSKHNIDSRPNFIYMTLPGSLLDQFASARGYRRIELQPDNANSTAGRHSAPLTRGSLYPLGLAGVDLREWIRGTILSDEEIRAAWNLSAFLHAQGESGRDKVTLLLPKWLSGAALWTKQNFEESLGKSERIGIKIVIDEKVKLANYRSPKDPLQDRVFLAVQEKGAASEDAQKIRRAGYPIASITFRKGIRLSRYMQFMHYVVFGLAYLRDMNFVTQPSVELYKAITNKLHEKAKETGGIEATSEWREFSTSPRRLVWEDSVTLHLDRVARASPEGVSAAEAYALLLKSLITSGKIEYAELTFFGDMRYSSRGQAMRKCLGRAAENVFRSRLKMPVDVYEGPAMNHSYHEMIIGHGKCLSTVLLSEQAESIPEAGYTADYHRAQFLATQMALAERGRHVVALTVKNLEESSLWALERFFKEVARIVKAQRIDLLRSRQ
jgi:hypothetical protein